MVGFGAAGRGFGIGRGRAFRRLGQDARMVLPIGFKFTDKVKALRWPEWAALGSRVSAENGTGATARATEPVIGYNLIEPRP